MTEVTHTGIQNRREELYGSSRSDAFRKLKGAMTKDHIHLLAQEGHNAGLPPWISTTKTIFKGAQPTTKTTLATDSGEQNSSHFEFRGDSSPIDDAIYKSSLSNADHSQIHSTKLPAMKLDPQVNLPDMNPRYWHVKTFGETFYDTDFSQTIKQSGLPSTKWTSEIRQRNARDLGRSHFRLGNDASNFKSETTTSFNASRPRSSGVRLDPIVTHRCLNKTQPSDLIAADFVKKMLEDERESYVFRIGDYNVKAPKEDVSTFMRDYNFLPKPNKAAAFIEPTQIIKGRFLQDATELREFLMEETKPWTTEQVPQTDVPLSNTFVLQQLFLQYDRLGTGYVSRPILKRVLDSLLDPIPAAQVVDLLRYSKWGEDGTVDYNDFTEKYMDMKPWKKPKIADELGIITVPNTTQDKPPSTTVRAAGTSHGSPSLDNASLGKAYQTSVHFKFGSDKDKPASIYNIEFDTDVQQDVIQTLKQTPPQSSEVMHVVPGIGFGTSSKQTSYVDFHTPDAEWLRQMTDERTAISENNKRRHNLNSVIMTFDSNGDAVDRQQSLSHASYVIHKDAQPGKQSEVHQPKYPYLKSDLALPFAWDIQPKVSEARDAFVGPNISDVEEEQAKLKELKDGNKVRVIDGKQVHFKFGNDGLSHLTEAMDQFSHNADGNDVMPAGKTNAEDTNYAHLESSQNTRDLNGNSMAPNNTDRINIAKKSYYHTLNPKDPLHINLRRALMDKDPNHTGRVTRREVKEACSQFQVKLSSNTMERLILRCDEHKDGTRIDYHQFVRALTMEKTTDEWYHAPQSSSIMRHDYRPLIQRSFTDAQLLTISHMDKKPIKPQPSHFFHMDSTGDTVFESMTAQDYIQPELQKA